MVCRFRRVVLTVAFFPSGELSINPQPHEDETSLRGLLYELITCESVKTVLRRTDYEEAVVAGRMAAGY